MTGGMEGRAQRQRTGWPTLSVVGQEGREEERKDLREGGRKEGRISVRREGRKERWR